MTAEAILTVGPGCDPVVAVHSLVEAAEQVKVTNWVEFPDSLLVFVMVPGDANSGTVYVLDRKPGVWYWVDFDDSQYGGYGVADLERLLGECSLLSLVERPGLLRTGLNWFLRLARRLWRLLNNGRNSSAKPAWLNEGMYLEKIQPRLAAITIFALSPALRVCESYAAASARADAARIPGIGRFLPNWLTFLRIPVNN